MTSHRLAHVFPGDASSAALRGTGEVTALLPPEAAAAQRFGPKRRAEFAAGRACARLALTSLGHDGAVLLPNADRTVCWPAGIVGSITHTVGYCAAVVAEATRWRAVGIDAERIGRVTEDMWPLLFTASEADRLTAAPRLQRAPLATLIFSAKETFYKCQYNLTGQWVDFHDVAVEVDYTDTCSGSFSLQATRPIPFLSALLPLWGRYEVDEELVVTGAAVSVPTRLPACRPMYQFGL